MRSLAKLSEREFDGILAGKANGGEFDDLAAFFREMRVGLDEALPLRVQERHLASMVAEARRVARSTPERSLRAPASTPKPRNAFRRLAARASIATISLTTLTAFGGAAYAGVLPDRLQGPVAEIARKVGISLPHKHDDPRHQHGLPDGAQHADNHNQHTTAGQHTTTNTRADTSKPTGNAQIHESTPLTNDDTTHKHRKKTGSNDQGIQHKQPQSAGGGNKNTHTHDGLDTPSPTSSGQHQSAHRNGEQSSLPTDAQAAPSEPAVPPTQDEQTTQTTPNQNSTPTGDSGDDPPPMTP